MVDELRILPVRGLPEVRPGDDLPALIVAAIAGGAIVLEDGDVVVIAQKVVSKAEGRLVALEAIEPSALATAFAAQFEKDPRHVEIVLRESRRISRMERGVLIVETKHGFICANAGVDASNVEGDTVVCLLPVDPDASAAAIRQSLQQATGRRLAVIISDTFGRPWREGQTNIAIGVAGIPPMRSYVGQTDQYGYELRVTALCDADELAGAAELVMGKTDQVPVAVVRGLPWQEAAAEVSGARQIVRPSERDLYR